MEVHFERICGLLGFRQCVVFLSVRKLFPQFVTPDVQHRDDFTTGRLILINSPCYLSPESIGLKQIPFQPQRFHISG